MRYINRALSGAALTLLTIGLVGVAGWRLHDSVTSSEPRKRPPARERSYAVDVGSLASTSVTPTITAYGQIQTWNSLEIRAPAAGPIIEISPNFRDGLSVKTGELLFRIDPENAQRRVIDAKAALAQAKFELSEATLNRAHVDAELASTKQQTTVRQRDLERKQALGRKRLITTEVLNAASLALSASKQSEIAKQAAVLTAKGRIDKAQADVERAELTLKDVEQSLRETSYRAPFSGRLTDVAATLGRRISQNEKLAALIDPTALEVSFLVRNSDFGHLLDRTNAHKLLPLPVKVTLSLSGAPIVIDGKLDRTAAVAASQSGRTVYAKLNASEGSVLRPGDFVSVTIDEPKLTNVAVIPTAAATNDGHILLVGEDGRLTQHRAKIMRRQGDNLIVGSIPFGRQFVRLYLPFLAPGVMVKPRQGTPAIASTKVRTQPIGGGGVVIDDAKRAAFIKLVKASRRMPEERRASILQELAKPNPSKAVVERLERRLARRSGRSRS